MRKIKVCILQNGFRHGGTDTFVINLCRGIDRDKFDISIINPCNISEKNIREGEVIKLGIPVVHTAGLDSRKTLLKHFWQLYKYLKTNKIDTFHTNIDLFNGPQLLIAKLAGVKNRVCHSHNGAQQKAIIKGSNCAIRAYQKVMRWMCKTFATRYTGCSEIALNFLFPRNIWHQDKYPSVICNGIDISRYGAHINVEAKKRELGLTAKKHIITVGRIIPQKNPLFLAKVFCELCKVDSDTDLIWVGSGELMNQCKGIFTKANVMSRIHFFEKRDDVDEILKCCDCFFMPSVFEGLPIALIEAQAANLPCLVSDSISTESNCGGVTFLSLDAPLSKWVATMRMLLLSPTEIDRQKLEKFSIQYMCKQLEQIFTI